MLKTETILIKKSNINYKKIDNLTYMAKNLYNRSLFLIKKHYKIHKKYLSFFELDFYFRNYEEKENYINFEHLKDIELYNTLPNNTSQQILKTLHSNFTSYFKSLKNYSKNKGKFKSIPKPPKFLNKKEGRYFLIFTSNQFKIKNNILSFPKKTNLSSIKINKNLKNKTIQQIRIVPKLNSYNIEIIYKIEEKLKENKNKFIGSIDLGLDNLCTFVSTNKKFKPIIFNGKIIKSINNYFNKLKGKFQSKLNIETFTSNKIKNLCSKRERKIKNELHLISKRIVNLCKLQKVSKLVIGYNENWKQNINLGSKTNQKFVSIPYHKLIQMLIYKCKENGIELTLNEESYTSKCSSIDLEEIKFHDIYLGKRIKRGLFESYNKILLNADVNAAYNILRKHLNLNKINIMNVSNVRLNSIISKGCMVHPVKINNINNSKLILEKLIY